MERTQVVISAATRVLLERGDAEILAASFSTDPADRFDHAHLAALRVAGAVLEAHGKAKVRGQSGNVWALMTRYVPELAEWAVYFAASGQIRGALMRGSFDVVDDRSAEKMLCRVEDFRDSVETHLGLGTFERPRLSVVRAS